MYTINILLLLVTVITCIYLLPFAKGVSRIYESDVPPKEATVSVQPGPGCWGKPGRTASADAVTASGAGA